MPVPTTIDQLSTVAANNYPSGTESPAVLDDVQRAHAAFIAGLRNGSGFAPGVLFSFAAGTRIAFAQAVAPVGWTQDVSDTANNRMLRVVSTAGGGTGGTATHSPILMNVVPAHTHAFSTGAQSADHTHGIGDPGHSHLYGSGGNWGSGSPNAFDARNSASFATTTSATGIWTGGMSNSHTHSGSTDNGSSQTNWQPRYIDMIICTKN